MHFIKVLADNLAFSNAFLRGWESGNSDLIQQSKPNDSRWFRLFIMDLLTFVNQEIGAIDYILSGVR